MPSSTIDIIRQIREFLKVDKSWVLGWLANHQIPSINELQPSGATKSLDHLIKDMCVHWASTQGIDEFSSIECYTDNVKSLNLASVQKWQQILFKGN
jgi:hypothetical protein